MKAAIRLFVLVEGVTFVAAALVHRGLFMPGYAHRDASLAESTIAAVLLLGLAASFVRPAGTRTIGLTVQAFALLGTLVGISTIVAGIGPRTVPDIAYHIGIVLVLGCGVVFAARAPAEAA